ncbi:MAG: hypothetical protein ACI9X4_002735 [Glaciecola sp.]
MTLSTTLLFGLCLFAPLPDITSPGYKKVSHQVAIENPKDFEGWRVFVAETFPVLHPFTEAEPGIPFSFSSKYGTRIYVLPSGNRVPNHAEDWDAIKDTYDNFIQAIPPVTSPEQVSVHSPVASVLTTIRIVDISDSGIQLEAVRTQEFDSNGKPVSWALFWVLPLGAVTCGVIGLIVLRKRRLKRALS